MLNPPFKRIASNPNADLALAEPVTGAARCCQSTDHGDCADGPAHQGRGKLAQLDGHFHCSVIGTCLGTADLRKLMAHFVDVKGASDLDIHHDAVRMTLQSAPVAKALQKALDQRHAPAIQRSAKLQDAQALGRYWDEALHQGEVPGAYWAVLTHRKTTTELRKKVFGDVHMLSHLVGAANRADIRRLVALERDNAELREKLERQQVRTQELVEEKDRRIAELAHEAIQAAAAQATLAAPARSDESENAAALIATQTERRERAEQAAAMAASEVARLAEELEHLRRHAMVLSRELGAAETQLREMSEKGEGQPPPDSCLDRQLRGRRILYVGGRPSSAPAIRDLVLRHGGELQRHGGGLEDRKGLLASAVAWAEIVVFPVDCIDHDSAGNLKRLCMRHQIPYVPLRGAGVGSFAAAFSSPLNDGKDAPAWQAATPICIRHG